MPSKRDRTEILLVEDNANDVALTLHAFKGTNLANRVHVGICSETIPIAYLRTRCRDSSCWI